MLRSIFRPLRSRAVLSPVLIAVLALGGVAAQRAAYPGAEDAAPYHNEVARVAKTFPKQLGPWIGSDASLPRSAVQLLKPNVTISRRYHHQTTGEWVKLMLVHCKRASDMSGHYPPNCYPANGFAQDRREVTQWQVAGDSLPIAQYTFSRSTAVETVEMHVLDMLILPDGTLTTNMGRVYEAAADYRQRYYGAGQLQMQVPADMSPQRRKEVFKRFYGELKPIIEAIRSGSQS